MRHTTRPQIEKKEMNLQETLKPQDMLAYLIVLTGIFVLFTLGGFSLIYADSITHIGIDFSNTCISLETLNQTNPCFDSDYVKLLYPPVKLKPNYQTMFDNLAPDEKTPYQLSSAIRSHVLACIQKDYCNIFELDENQKYVYWYDLDRKPRDYIDKIITIHPNILHKSLIGTKYDIIDNEESRTLTLDINQLSIRSCRNVAYSPDFLPFEMGFIINYLSNDCKDKTDLGKLAMPYTEPLTKSEIDVTTSANWLYLNSLEELKNKYRENRIGKD